MTGSMHGHPCYDVRAAGSQANNAEAAREFSVAAGYVEKFTMWGMRGFDGMQVLEIGPGVNFSSAFVFKALGAAEVHVADRFLLEFDEDYHSGIYRDLRDMTREAYPHACLDIFDQCIETCSYDVEGLHRHMTGAENLCGIASSSIDIILSNAVLEHLVNPVSAFREFSRISARGGMGSHQVDFRYHADFSRPLEFLLLSDEELSALESVCCSLGNGWRPCEYRKLFEKCGFDILNETTDTFANDEYLEEFMPRLRGARHSRFHLFSREELSKVSSHFMVRKR